MKTHWQRAFLTGLENTGSVTQAAEAAKISRQTVYENKQNDPEFSRQWDEALEQSADALEEEARKRAFAGSDVLLIFMLKGLRPQRWRESRATIPPAELNKMIETELKRLADKNDSESASGFTN
jgi:hypothetical protein